LSFFTKNIVRLFNSVVLISIVIGLGIFTLIIGYYNYQTSMNELRNKAANTGDLAAISLKEPLWNYDETAMQDIFVAILLDKDVVAIRVLKDNDEKPIAEKQREGTEDQSFDELLKDPVNVDTTSAIVRDGKQFAKVQIVTSSEKVQALIRYTTLLITAFALVFVILLSSFIWYLGVRIIKKPIDALRGSADNLARGNLNETINTSRNDELGSLAVSFDQMRNAIRKKLSDLAVLNQTGEKLSKLYFCYLFLFIELQDR
jgi:methyl-accepting chemotaxis protein